MLYRDLQYFVVLAEDPDLVRASLTLGVTQPTLRAAVKRLERAYQRQFLHRSRAGLTLTLAGHEMFFYASRLLSLHAEAASAIRIAGSEVTGERLAH